MNEFKSNWIGSKTKSIDGTGDLPSVTEVVSKNIYAYISKEFPNVNKILDIGAGKGLLQKTIEEISDCTVWSLEGYAGIDFQANKDRLIISDATIKFDQNFYKSFDLVTSFECIEHIPLEGQDVLWENIFFSSNHALVGIHCENEENEYHCLIRKEVWWNSFFSERGIKYKLLGSPQNPWKVWPEACCSLFYKLEKI